MGFNLTTFKQLLVKTGPSQEHDLEGTASTSVLILYNNSYGNPVPDTSGNWYFDFPSGTVLNSFKMNVTALTSLSIKDTVDFSNVASCERMFAYCGFSSIDLSNFDFSSSTSTKLMFQFCSDLVNVNLRNTDFSNVTDMSLMFEYCESLSTFNCPNLVTNAVTDLSYMFQGCSSLTSINVSNWDTSNVTSLLCMFQGCNNLTYLDASSWNTSRMTDIGGMFTSGQLTLRADNWDTRQVQHYGNFVQDLSTVTIYYNPAKWNSSIVSEFSNVNWVAV